MHGRTMGSKQEQEADTAPPHDFRPLLGGGLRGCGPPGRRRGAAVRPVPEACRESMERARECRRAYKPHHAYRVYYSQERSKARRETRSILYRKFGYRREDRRLLNCEKQRAMEAGRRCEGALAERWGVK